jgi:hypothetical protein
MEMVSSTIIDFRFFFRRWDLSPDVSGSVGRSKFSRYGPSDLASQDRSWIFLMVATRSISSQIFPGCYVIDDDDSCSRFPSDVDQVVRLLFISILVLLLVPMVIVYFNSYVRAHILSIVAQIKIMGEPSLVLSGLLFGIYLRLPLGKYKNVYGRRKSLKTSKIC